MRVFAEFLFLLVSVLLLAAWFLAWVIFHIASAVIHLLLVIAVIALLLHLFQRHRTVV